MPDLNLIQDYNLSLRERAPLKPSLTTLLSKNLPRSSPTTLFQRWRSERSGERRSWQAACVNRAAGKLREPKRAAKQPSFVSLPACCVATQHRQEQLQPASNSNTELR